MTPKGRPSFTLVELLVLIVVVGTLALVFFAGLKQAREQRRIDHCKGNLRNLGTSMVQYIDQFGKGRYYTWPGTRKASFNGAQWMVSLYWCSLMNEADLFVCPSEDDNANGARLGRKFTSLDPSGVSYAGRNGMRGAIVDKMRTSTVMLSDDSEGADNHNGGINILFFDAHVDFARGVKPTDIGVNKPVDMLRN